MAKIRPTRREFIETVGLAAGGYAATAFGYPANESLSIGCIGTGGRCRRLMQSLQAMPGIRMTAVCDIWDNALAEAQKLAAPGAFASKDYRRVLERKDIDAVLIGSPDHWHVPMTVDACAAGKDVFVEKPLTHDLSEGRQVLEAVRNHRRIVQVGTQQRSMPHLQKAFEIIKSGRLGRIHKVHMTWNRNSPAPSGRASVDPNSLEWAAFLGKAPQQPFDAFRFRNWRFFWDFGGGILTDLMVHWLDVVYWYLDLDTPADAAAIGDHFNSKGIWETPDTIQAFLRYPDREMQAYFEGTFVNARNGAMTEFMGTEATLYIDRGRYEIHPERKPGTKTEPNQPAAKPEEWILGEGPRGADFYRNPDGETLHLSNWLECIRTRKEPNAPVEAGVRAAAAAHLGNIAYRQGKVARWEEHKP